jgi:tRNA1Val (adenine37-N6)-methyltransferase
MSSINYHYTFNYSQPEAYRFSHDSVFLARRVFELLRKDIKPEWEILDLCAGCGIVGLDFLFHCYKEQEVTPARCDFLEIQAAEYAESFEINRTRLNLLEIEMDFLAQNYTAALPRTYDLILCNPPYFEPSEGLLSPNRLKNRSRFFMDATQVELTNAIARALKPGGRAFVLSRSPEKLARATGLDMQVLGDIRGTALIQYCR